jgi:hypothetical protein
MSKLWVVGCSIAHGIGVEQQDRWGELVGKQFGIEPTFLTAEGSSIEWAANRILQADIAQDDIVCWGLTTPNRSLWYNDSGKEQHVLNVYYHNYPDFLIDRRHLVDLNLAYKAVNYVKQVQNYLGKIGCRYAIGYTLPGLRDHREILLKNLTTTPGFLIMYNQDRVSNTDTETFFKSTKPSNKLFDDVGSDGFHPGPQQHKLYAEQFLKVLSKSLITQESNKLSTI